MKGFATSLSLFIFLAIPSIGEATVVKAHTLYQKTNISKLVVKGQVESIRSEWFVENASAHTLITLKVTETFKGQVPKSKRIIVRQAGGKIGDFDHRVEGISRWEINEEVIMFLEPLPTVKTRKLYVELGIGIGKYEIKKRGKQSFVHHNPRVALAHVSENKKMRVEPAPVTKPVALKDFVKQIRNYLSGKDKPVKRVTPKEAFKTPTKSSKPEVKKK
jgi:hypothetical protein